MNKSAQGGGRARDEAGPTAILASFNKLLRQLLAEMHSLSLIALHPYIIIIRVFNVSLRKTELYKKPLSFQYTPAVTRSLSQNFQSLASQSL